MAEEVSSTPEVANHRALYTKVALGSLVAIGIAAIPVNVVEVIEGAQGQNPGIIMWVSFVVAVLVGGFGRWLHFLAALVGVGAWGLGSFLREITIRCSQLRVLLLPRPSGEYSRCRVHRLHLWPRRLFPVPPAQPPCFSNWLGSQYLWPSDRGGCGARHRFGNCLYSGAEQRQCCGEGRGHRAPPGGHRVQARPTDRPSQPESYSGSRQCGPNGPHVDNRRP